MTIYKPGDVLYAPMSFVGQSANKPRPVAVLFDTGDQDIVIARITSQNPRDPYDINIADLKTAGLTQTSILRLSKVATIPRAQVIKRLGKLSPSDRSSVRAALRKIANLWV